MPKRTGLATLLTVTIGLPLLLPSPARSGKKDDEKITPPAPYTLFVVDAGGNKKTQAGTEAIRTMFDAKNAKKPERKRLDPWFRLVASREEAEIVIEITGLDAVNRYGYRPSSWVEGRLTVRGLVEAQPVRGDDPYYANAETVYLLRNVIDYLRSNHKEAVLAHQGETAAPD